MVKDFWGDYYAEKVEKPKPSAWQGTKKKIAKRLDQPTFKGGEKTKLSSGKVVMKKGKKTRLGGGTLKVKYRNPFLGIRGL